MEIDEKDLIYVAKVKSTRGIDGEVRVNSLFEISQSIKWYKYFFVEGSLNKINVSQTKVFKKHIGIKFEESNNIYDADNLAGKKLYIQKNQLPKLSEESWYHYDLIGLAVKDLDNNLLGKVSGVHNFGAGDIIEIEFIDGKNEMLLFDKSFIKDVDVEKNMIVIGKTGV